jgi:hypothetical protein
MCVKCDQIDDMIDKLESMIEPDMDSFHVMLLRETILELRAEQTLFECERNRT